ncbi:MAG: site-specific integrase [Myxococcales bacterium]|nr:site-specific integrase [Myxococcales bacterium]
MRGASDHTIHKELGTFRGALKRARWLGLFSGDPAIFRAEHSPNYEPRRRFLTTEEFGKLIDALPLKRRLTVAFITYSAARDSEWQKVEREHVDFLSTLTLPGTKTRRAWRQIPLREHEHLGNLLRNVVATLHKDKTHLFEPWTNIRRDLHVACKKAGIDPVSPNDLRRTFASWCWQQGMPPARIALLLGHRDARMVERVYGVMDSATLGQDTAKVFGNLDLPELRKKLCSV